MRINNMTLSQLTKIINNNYLGEHSKSGKQVDYHDYQSDILKHYWSLSSRAIQSKSVSRSVDVLETDDLSTISVSKELALCDLAISVNRAFKPWRDLGCRLMMGIN